MDATFERVRDRKGNLQIFLDEVTVDLQNIEALLAMPSPPEAS
jgi:hypothetical protein